MALWSDFEGKTVDAALKKASRELNIPVDKMNYEIVFAGSSGIFGLVGVKNARIRVNATSHIEAAKDRDDIQVLLEETFSVQKPEVTPDEGEATGASRKKKPQVPPGSRQHQTRTKARPQETSDQQPAKEVDEAVIQLGRETLQKIVDVITEGAVVSSRSQQKETLFNISNGNSGVLIGKHGQTLKAMQHIVEKVMQAAQGERVQALVDVESYLEKRREALKSLAVKKAEKARQTGKPAIINRMDSFERKIIHDVLKKDKSVNTKSTGNGDVRSVVIHPGKKKENNKLTAGK